MENAGTACRWPAQAIHRGTTVRRRARATQEIAALNRAVKELEDRHDALEREKREQVVREGFAENGALINLLLKQRTDDRTLADQRYDALIARIDKNQTIADQRHTQIMAQFEKLLARPSEN